MGNLGKHQKFKSSNSALWVALTIVVVLISGYFSFPEVKAGLNEAFDILTSDNKPRIKSWVKQFGALGPLVLIAAMTLQMFLLIIPNLLLFIIAILCYGPIWGALICLVGVFSSSSLGFLIGRNLGPAAISRFVSQQTQQKVKSIVNQYGIKAIAIARLSSLASDALGFVAGILEMEYKKFMIATITGVVPVIVLIAIFGNNGKIEKALIWIGSISLLILMVNIFLDKKKTLSDRARDCLK